MYTKKNVSHGFYVQSSKLYIMNILNERVTKATEALMFPQNISLHYSI